MTMNKRLKLFFQIKWARFTALKFVRRLRSVFSKTLNEKPQPLQVEAEFRAAAFRLPESPTGEIRPDTDLKTPSPDAPPNVPLEQNEADFHGLNNLEAFAKGTTVKRETIERWVAAGILSPQETRVAEKLIRLMQKNAHRSTEGDNGSPPA